MRKILAVALVAALVSLTVPASQAETVTNTYTGTAGVRVLGVGPAVMCPQNCYNLGLLPDNVGGAHLETSGATYTNVVVNVNDEGFWGPNAAISTCFWNPGGDNICDDDDYGSETGCGGVSLLGSPFAGDYVTVWVRTVAVLEDLTVCGGTFGSVSGNFF